MKDQLLISLVEGFPNLYNRSNASYKDEVIKQSSWETIATALEMDVMCTKKRWDYLRDRFVRAYRQYTNEMDSGLPAEPGSKYHFPYFNEMQFITKHIRKRKMTSSRFNDPSEHSKEIETSNFGDNFNISKDQLSDSISSPEPFQYSTSQPIIEFFERDAPPSKKNCKDCYADTLTKMMKSFDKYLETNHANGDGSFMKSVVEDMQQLSKVGKITFKHEVYKLLQNLCQQYPAKK